MRAVRGAPFRRRLPWVPAQTRQSRRSANRPRDETETFSSSCGVLFRPVVPCRSVTSCLECSRWAAAGERFCAQNKAKHKRRQWLPACHGPPAPRAIRSRFEDGWVGAVSDAAGSVGPDWKKSSLSAHNGNCVEVAQLRGGDYGIRDSKDVALGSPVLTFSLAEWRYFLEGVKAGEFDLP